MGRGMGRDRVNNVVCLPILQSSPGLSRAQLRVVEGVGDRQGGGLHPPCDRGHDCRVRESCPRAGVLSAAAPDARRLLVRARVPPDSLLVLAALQVSAVEFSGTFRSASRRF